MTAVTIRPTFKKDSRPNNGLETIADEMIADNARVFYVVGTVKWAGGSLSEEGELLPAAKFLAIEPLAEESSAEELAKKILDDARKARGLGRVEESIPKTGQMAGQIPFEFDGEDDGEPRQLGEVRLTDDGPREVPEPSGEEILAEREEAKAGVPAAEFSGGEA